MKYHNYTPNFYPESRFGGFTDADGTIAFYSRVNAMLDPSFTVLDAGCGRGKAVLTDSVLFRRNLRCIRGKVAKVIGIDVDPVGESNQMIDEFRLINKDGTWPVESNSVNMVISDCVLEHVPDPDAYFAEVARVLVPGGYLCMKTPNVLSYFGLAARMIPERMHDKVLDTVYEKYIPEDKFPTLYRCNTVFAIRKVLVRHGLQGVVYGTDAEPGYLSFSKLAYRIGVFHQRHAPQFLKIKLFVFAQRPLK